MLDYVETAGENDKFSNINYILTISFVETLKFYFNYSCSSQEMLSRAGRSG